ncbi:hypothetical protein ACYPKM_05350 [Pseudomonas aeruginosa]
MRDIQLGAKLPIQMPLRVEKLEADADRRLNEHLRMPKGGIQQTNFDNLVDSLFELAKHPEFALLAASVEHKLATGLKSVITEGRDLTHVIRIQNKYALLDQPIWNSRKDEISANRVAASAQLNQQQDEDHPDPSWPALDIAESHSFEGPGRHREHLKQLAGDGVHITVHESLMYSAKGAVNAMVRLMKAYLASPEGFASFDHPIRRQIGLYIVENGQKAPRLTKLLTKERKEGSISPLFDVKAFMNGCSDGLWWLEKGDKDFARHLIAKPPTAERLATFRDLDEIAEIMFKDVSFVGYGKETHQGLSILATTLIPKVKPENAVMIRESLGKTLYRVYETPDKETKQFARAVYEGDSTPETKLSAALLLNHTNLLSNADVCQMIVDHDLQDKARAMIKHMAKGKAEKEAVLTMKFHVGTMHTRKKGYGMKAMQQMFKL